jgi:hypothetical protein
LLGGPDRAAAGAQGKVPSAISIGVRLSPAGVPTAAPQVEVSGPARDLLRPIADTVVQAIKRCQPYAPAADVPYLVWRDVSLRISLQDELGPSSKATHGP